MPNTYQEQENLFDEVMGRLDALRQDASPAGQEPQTQGGSVVDEEIFDAVRRERQIPPAKERSPILRLLEEEEDEEDVPDAPSILKDEPIEPIEDYGSEEDRDEIYRDLKHLVGKMAVKSVALLLLAAVSVYLFAAGFQPALFGGNTGTVWYQLAFLAVDVLALIFSFGIFMQGLAGLIRTRAGTDTLLALLCIALIALRITAIIRPMLLPFVLNFEPMLTIGLWFNVLSKKKIAANIKRNFKEIAVSGDKMTVTVPASCETNNDLILETGEGGDVMYAHQTKLVTRYIEHSYRDFDWERETDRFFFVTILLILAGTVALSQLVTLGAALLFPAAALAISVPFFARYYFAAPIWTNGKEIRRNGGVLTSARSAKELEDADLLVMSEEAFLGEGSVLLQGVKALGPLQIDELITDIAALFGQIDSPFKTLFHGMIDHKTVQLPRVDDLYDHDGQGYSCLIHSKLFLVGTASLMRQFNIDFPDHLLDLQLGDCRFPVYVAYHKAAAGVFIAGYQANEQTLAGIRLAEAEQFGIGIVNHDFNFTPQLLQKLYPLNRPELFRFISAKTGAACQPMLARAEKADDLIASKTGLRGLAACLYGASKLLTALKINRVIRILYTLLSLGLIFFIALSGYSANTALQILIFQMIWMVPVYLICTFCK